MWKKLNTIAKPGSILATNTSGLDINEIASMTDRPENIIGLHFFSPANVMKLLGFCHSNYRFLNTLCQNLAKSKNNQLCTVQHVSHANLIRQKKT